jgi:hypothetical protein
MLLMYWAPARVASGQVAHFLPVRAGHLPLLQQDYMSMLLMYWALARVASGQVGHFLQG